MKLVAKSRAACLSAVETYNRASALYREDTFAILMINAWELLLKARVMRENGGKVSSLHEFRPRKKKDGTNSKNKEVRRTRSGAPMTIGLDKCCKLVAGYPNDRIDQHCIANIEALMEIRDSATHFVATDALLRKALTQISMASVRNYVTAAQAWFKVSFSDLNIASIPISFDLDQKEVDAVAKKAAPAVTQFLTHMKTVESQLPNTASDFAFSIRVDFDLIKKKQDGAVTSAIVAPQDAELTVALEADAVPAGYSLSYHDFVEKVISKYDVVRNSAFHKLMAAIKSNPKYCYERLLAPSNNKSGKKPFYNPNALKEFDAHYPRKGATLFEPEAE